MYLDRNLGDNPLVDGRIDEIAATVAAVTRAAGTALDPTTILARTFAALAPAVPVSGATLWLGDETDLRLAASFPDDRAGVSADGHVVPLVGADRPIGQLVVAPPSGTVFGDSDRALLEIAGGQIAGALERARLFQEVMELERLKSDFIAFEMFTRSQGTTAVPGLGVGLPIARTLVEVLDGDIVVDHAHTGTGALLRITLTGPA